MENKYEFIKDQDFLKLYMDFDAENDHNLAMLEKKDIIIEKKDIIIEKKDIELIEMKAISEARMAEKEAEKEAEIAKVKAEKDAEKVAEIAKVKAKVKAEKDAEKEA